MACPGPWDRVAWRTKPSLDAGAAMTSPWEVMLSQNSSAPQNGENGDIRPFETLP